MLLKPPSLFAIVETGVFRSNAPLDENLPFLDLLQLRTVLFLSPEVLLRTVVEFFQDRGIRIHNLGLEAWRPEPDWTCLSDEFLKDALEMLLDAQNHPILVCCTSGIFQTAPLVGCLRRLQNWSLTAILDEYRAFAGPRGRLTHEQYIEFFDVDLVTLPAEEGRLPVWFVDYNVVDVREREKDLAVLRRELEALEAKALGEQGGLLTAEEEATKRRAMFVLRCSEAQRSTMLCSPGTRLGKQSLVDEDDDD